MRILLLGINYAPEAIGIAVYTQGMCEALVAMGHSVRVVAAKPYYPYWKVQPGYGHGWTSTEEKGVRITRCPLYVPAQPSGARRIFHHASFALSALIPMIVAAVRWKPDIVLTVAPSLVAAPIARFAATIAGARNWLHVQDFEVEAAFAMGLMNAKSPVSRFARKLERRIVGSFDRLSSISPEMCAKLRSFGIRRESIVELRNWTDVDAVQPLAGPSSYRMAWNVDTPHVALYSGNIANKQGIDIVLDAARALAGRSDIMFVICAQGPNRAALEQRAAGLSNIQFHDFQPVERLGDLLGLATIHLLPQKANAADLVLPSKLTNMLASGRPVVATAAHGTGLAREVEGCGIVTPPGDAEAFAAAIARLADDRPLHAQLSIAARARAEQVWNRIPILDQFERDLQAACALGNDRQVKDDRPGRMI